MPALAGPALALYLIWIQLTRQTVSWYLVTSQLYEETPLFEAVERIEAMARERGVR